VVSPQRRRDENQVLSCTRARTRSGAQNKPPRPVFIQGAGGHGANSILQQDPENHPSETFTSWEPLCRPRNLSSYNRKVPGHLS